MWRWAISVAMAGPACTEVYDSTFRAHAGPDKNLGYDWVSPNAVDPKLDLPPSGCPFFDCDGDFETCNEKAQEKCPSPCEANSCAAGEYCLKGYGGKCIKTKCKKNSGFADEPQPPEFAWKIIAVRPLHASLGCDLDGDGAGDSAFGAWGGSQLKTTVEAAVAKGKMLRVLAPFPGGEPGDIRPMLWTGAELPRSATPCDQLSASGNCVIDRAAEFFSVDIADMCERKSWCSGAIKGDALEANCVLMSPGGLPIGSEWSPPGYGVTITGKIPALGSLGTLRFCGHWLAKDIGNNALYVKGELIALSPDLDLDADGKPESVSFAAEVDVVRAQLKQGSW